MARSATIAIVGRPNVGKSTLFNRLVGKRLALVDDQPGVTRDRREGDGKLLGLEFRIVDTAGFEDQDAATLPGRMRVQTEKAVREADAALFMIDGRAGVTPLDEEIARWLRSENTPIILLVNKAEGKQGENGLMESYSLGFDNPVALSAEHGEGVVDLFDALHAVDFAEVVVLLLDATKGLEAQDLRIADRVLQEGRALIVALNKWDVAEDPSSLYNGVRGALDDGLSQVKGVPVLTISGATGKGIDTLVRVAFEQRDIWTNRVSTAKLNRWFEAAVDANPPPAPGGKRIKLRYITQARTRPPTFVVFGTRTDALPGSYERYLVNGMRKELGFQGVPVRLNFRNSRNPYDE